MFVSMQILIVWTVPPAPRTHYTNVRTTLDFNERKHYWNTVGLKNEKVSRLPVLLLEIQVICSSPHIQRPTFHHKFLQNFITIKQCVPWLVRFAAPLICRIVIVLHRTFLRNRSTQSDIQCEEKAETYSPCQTHVGVQLQLGISNSVACHQIHIYLYGSMQQCLWIHFHPRNSSYTVTPKQTNTIIIWMYVQLLVVLYNSSILYVAIKDKNCNHNVSSFSSFNKKISLVLKL